MGIGFHIIAKTMFREKTSLAALLRPRTLCTKTSYRVKYKKSVFYPKGES